LWFVVPCVRILPGPDHPLERHLLCVCSPIRNVVQLHLRRAEAPVVIDSARPQRGPLHADVFLQTWLIIAADIGCASQFCVSTAARAGGLGDG